MADQEQDRTRRRKVGQTVNEMIATIFVGAAEEWHKNREDEDD